MLFSQAFLSLNEPRGQHKITLGIGERHHVIELFDDHARTVMALVPIHHGHSPTGAAHRAP